MSGAVISAANIAVDKKDKSPDGSGSLEGGDGGNRTRSRYTRIPTCVSIESLHPKGLCFRCLEHLVM